MTNPPVHDLARPESGFRIEPERLAHLDTRLAVALQSVRGLADKDGFPGELAAKWDRDWEHAGKFLHEIRNLLTEMDRCVGRGDTDSLPGAMKAWKAMQSRDVELTKALDGIRSDAARLHGEARRNFDTLDSEIGAQLDAIHACALALRVKMELMKDYTGGEVNHVLAGMLGKLPSRAQATAADAEKYVQEYRQTQHDLASERHEFGGFMDFIKGLAMWVDTPEERMRKNSDNPRH